MQPLRTGVAFLSGSPNWTGTAQILRLDHAGQNHSHKAPALAFTDYSHLSSE
jgi:hypothetical protein